MSLTGPTAAATARAHNTYNTHTLLTAAKESDPDRSLAITTYLLSLNANPNAPYSRYGDTPLQWAAEEAHPEVVRALLEVGADPRAVDRNGTTALHYARDPVTAQLLLQHKADPNAKDFPSTPFASTPFECAKSRGFTDHQVQMRTGNFKAALLLVKAGAEVDFTARDLSRCSTLGVCKLLAAASRRTSDLERRDRLLSYEGPQVSC